MTEGISAAASGAAAPSASAATMSVSPAPSSPGPVAGADIWAARARAGRAGAAAAAADEAPAAAAAAPPGVRRDDMDCVVWQRKGGWRFKKQQADARQPQSDQSKGRGRSSQTRSQSARPFISLSLCPSCVCRRVPLLPLSVRSCGAGPCRQEQSRATQRSGGHVWERARRRHGEEEGERRKRKEEYAPPRMCTALWLAGLCFLALPPRSAAVGFGDQQAGRGRSTEGVWEVLTVCGRG
jgi:hypothetical protein